jgi:hypothetical protein
MSKTVGEPELDHALIALATTAQNAGTGMPTFLRQSMTG